MEIWQADTHGRYAHPADRNPAPLDPNFEGHARVLTDAEGHDRIKTIKPGTYPINAEWSRPPLIHFDIHGRGTRLATQIYFEGDPLNPADRILQSTGGPEMLVARYRALGDEMEASALAAVWDVVIPEP